MIPASIKCPRQHESAVGTRICSSCGWLFPLAVGESMGEYTVIQVQTQLKQHHYWVQKDQSVYRATELVEFMSETDRKRLYEVLNQSPFDAGIEDYFFYTVGRLRLLYTLTPEHTLSPLQDLLDSQGLLSSLQIERLFSQLRQLCLALKSVDIVLPVWHPAHFSWGDDRRLSFHGWQHCCFRNHQIYPQYWLGYHGAVLNIKDSRLSLPEKMQRSSLYSLCSELILNQSPAFWAPQWIRLDSFRSLFTHAFWEKWKTYAQSLHPEDLPDEKPFRIPEQALYQSLKRAAHAFSQAILAYEQQDYDLAQHHLEQARSEHQLGSQIPRFMALVLKAQNEPGPAYFTLMDEAIRAEPLAVLFYERGETLFEMQHIKLALEDGQKAISKSPLYPEAYFLVGRCYQLMGELQKAEAYLESALKQRQSALYRQVLNDIYIQQGRLKQAEQTAFNLSQGGRKTALIENIRRSEAPLFIACACGNQNDLASSHCTACQQPLTPQKGDKISGYTITVTQRSREIESGFLRGAVYFVQDADGNNFVLKEHLVRHFSQHFQQHFLKLQQLRHPYLAALENVFVENGFGYLVFPHYSGASLATLLKEGPLEQAELSGLLAHMWPVLNILSSQGAVHGDIKPDNIWRLPDGQWVLIDSDSIFWTAQEQSPFREAVRTFPFSPMECVEGEITAAPIHDLYALGVTLLQAATGFFPELFYVFEKKQFENYTRFTGHLDPRFMIFVGKLLDLEYLKAHFSERENFQLAIDDAPPLSEQVPLQHRQFVRAFYHLHTYSQDDEGLQEAVEDLLQYERSGMTYHFVANTYLRLGNLEEALKYVRFLGRLFPDSCRVLWLTGEIYTRLGLFKPALQVYQRSAYLLPNFYLSWISVARTQRALGEQKEALLAYCEGLARHKNPNTALLLELASYEVELGMFAEALKHLDRLSGRLLSRLEREAFYQLKANILLEFNDLEDARLTLEQAFQMSPYNPQIIYNLALVNFKQKHFEQSEGYFKQLNTSSHYRPKALFGLVEIYLETRQFELAFETLQELKALKVWPEAELSFQEGRVLTYVGRYWEAIDAYRHSLSLKPTVAAYLNLGNLYVILEQEMQALQCFQAAKSIEPKSKVVQHAFSLLKKT